jgi:hypothetical protein
MQPPKIKVAVGEVVVGGAEKVGGVWEGAEVAGEGKWMMKDVVDDEERHVEVVGEIPEKPQLPLVKEEL